MKAQGTAKRLMPQKQTDKKASETNPTQTVWRRWTMIALVRMTIEEAKTILQRMENPIKKWKKEDEKWRNEFTANMKAIISSRPMKIKATPDTLLRLKLFKDMSVDSLTRIAGELVALRKERREKIENDILFPGALNH